MKPLQKTSSIWDENTHPRPVGFVVNRHGAKTLLPGVMGLLGLQALAFFTPVFLQALVPFEQGLHFFAFFLNILCMSLLGVGVLSDETAPLFKDNDKLVGFSRIVEQTKQWALLPFVLSTGLELLLLGRITFLSNTWSILFGLLGTAVTAFFFIIWPRLLHKHSQVDPKSFFQISTITRKKTEVQIRSSHGEYMGE